MSAVLPNERVMRKPHQSRAVKTRQTLVASAVREFSARGYAGATSKSIAKAAGVATGTFYQYFTDKDAVLREIAADRVMRVSERTVANMAPPVTAEASVDTADPSVGGKVDEATALPLLALIEQQVAAIVDVVIAHHRDDPGLHAVLTERRHADPELDRITTDGERELVHGIGALLSRWGREGDVEATAFVLFGMVEGAVHAHVLGARVVDDTRFKTALVDAVMRVALPTPKNTEAPNAAASTLENDAETASVNA